MAKLQPPKVEKASRVQPVQAARAALPSTPQKLQRTRASQSLQCSSPQDVQMTPGSGNKTAPTPKSTPIRSPPVKKPKNDGGVSKTLFADEKDTQCQTFHCAYTLGIIYVLMIPARYFYQSQACPAEACLHALLSSSSCTLACEKEDAVAKSSAASSWANWNSSSHTCIPIIKRFSWS